MAAEYAIREIEPQATPDILELVRLGLGSGSVPRSAEFWNWKHVDNPFGPSYGLAAEAEGRLVGLRMFLRWRFRSGDHEIPAVRAVDTVTHPEWQGKGIFTRLTLELLRRVEVDGVAFVFNTPNAKSRAGYLKMGWRDVGRVPVAIRPLRPLRMLLGLNGDAPDLDGFGSVEQMLAECDVDALVPAPDRRLTTDRSERYLRWRYADMPGGEYVAVWERRDDAWAALVLRPARRRGKAELRIAERLERGPDGGGAPRSLPQSLFRRVSATSGLDYLVGTRDDTTTLPFVPLPGLGPRLTARPLDRKTPPPETWSGWRLSAGDLEVF